VILIAGDVAQLDTGEGKTLVGALAASALALAGRGVHVVTANEFLAERDSQWFSPVYSTLGLTVGLSREGSNLAARRAAHAADVTYATALSLGLDFLHGDLALDAADVATRPPFAAVIDEVDAVLLDDARLPIAISITDRVQSRPFARFALAVSDLEQGRDVYVDLSTDTISLLPSGLSKVQDRLGVSNLYDNHTSAAHVQLALRSRFSLTEGREFVVAPDSTGRSSAVLVDPVTSLARPHARMRDGLHEALEARLGLDVSPSAQVRASTTVNGVFSRYEILAGMGGTASNAAADLRELYDMKVYTIPPHLPSQRRDHPAR
jgi:preprotein translocase subunit SecA